MLNLSDKDLDRLSQEAAQQHEPGDIVGPKFWEKLEARLDRDLGKVNPNPARGIRRLPYYFAPALIVLLGVTYYLVRLNSRSNKGTTSGSPPLTLVKPAPADLLKPSSSSNPVRSDKSNSTPVTPSNTVPYPGTAGTTRAAHPPAPSTDASPSGASSNVGPSSAATSPLVTHIHTRNKPDRRRRNITEIGAIRPTAANSVANTKLTDPNTTANPIPAATTTNPGTPVTTPAGANPTRSTRELTYSAVRGPIRLTRGASIDDSALRAFTLSSIRQPITPKRSLHVNRSLTFGILGGPDFASVNSVAGDRSGSTIGLTVDYQFANHWYIGSGLLVSKKVFGAAPQDYHVPANYYTRNLGMGDNVEYIKGSFTMLEIPLNLRYDFSTTGNTLFFASVGTSSYFFTTENCGYFFSTYNQRTGDKKFTYTNQPDNLFNTVNLSMGFETGLSNSLSILVAPYLKMPVRNMGFGQVQLSSFGIDFALRFTPVISRRRR